MYSVIYKNVLQYDIHIFNVYILQYNQVFQVMVILWMRVNRNID